MRSLWRVEFNRSGTPTAANVEVHLVGLAPPGDRQEEFADLKNDSASVQLFVPQKQDGDRSHIAYAAFAKLKATYPDTPLSFEYRG